jgi:poly(A) polymerase
MKGCSQNEYHHVDVWDHSLEALEKLEGLLASLTDLLERATGRLGANLAQANRLSVLKLAMLLHDAGKPDLNHEAVYHRTEAAAGMR